MQDIVRRYYEASARPHSGASEVEMRTLEQSIEITLPDDLVALYRQQNGAADFGALPFRLMSLVEVHEWHDMMRAYYDETGDFNWLDHGVTAFWSDDNSNYAGLYLTEPLRGYVCFLDHEDSYSIPPIYHSVRSFLRASVSAADHGLDWWEMRTDYPVCDHTTAAEYATEDWEVAQALYRLFDATPITPPNAAPDANEHERWERAHYAYCIMALTPFEQTQTLYRFVQEMDPYIPERACDILGCRRDETAVPLLAEVAARGTHNGQLAAVHALGRIGTSECLVQLMHLIEHLPSGFEASIAEALEGCGCEVTHDGELWRYRLPNTEQWVPIRLRQ